MHVSDFNPVGGFAGGVLIGAASTALLYVTGKITGISGIAHSLVTARSFHSLTGWRLSYIAGMVGTGAVLQAVWPAAFGDPSTLRPWAGVVAGLLVGFGTRLGSGCTSGHGVCGLPRLSPRSLLAVLTFMGTGAATASVVRSAPVYPLFYQPTPWQFGAANSGASLLGVLPTLGVIAVGLLLFRKPNWLTHGDGAGNTAGEDPISTLAEHATSLATSSVFAVALAMGGMTNPAVVQGFLDFAGSRGWNPTLAGVMGGAVIVNLASFAAMRAGGGKPLLEAKRTFTDIITVGTAKANMVINWQLIAGSALFGVGWGMAGFCPGPALVSLGARSSMASIVVPSMLVGMAVYEAVMGAGLWHARHHHHGHKHAHGHTEPAHPHAHAHTHAHAHAHAHEHSHGADAGAAHAAAPAAAPAPAPAALLPEPSATQPLLAEDAGTTSATAAAVTGAYKRANAGSGSGE